MSTTLGSLRRLVLTPALSEVSFARRGFPGASSPAASHLEAVPQSVICGFEWGIDVRSLAELECRLGLVQPQLRGFAYEGATMAYTILDAMRPRRGHRTEELLRGPGQPHLFLAYIGIGFAMSHLPRFLWNGVVPDLSGSPYHPTMSWLAVDGYGFDRAYFDTARVVDGQVRPAAYPWDGSAGYFPRAIDQGIGRALWFIHGARVPDVAAAVGRFAVQRRSDLWSGVGLAATFAGAWVRCGGSPSSRIPATRHIWPRARSSRPRRGCSPASYRRTRRPRCKPWRTCRCPWRPTSRTQRPRWTRAARGRPGTNIGGGPSASASASRRRPADAHPRITATAKDPEIIAPGGGRPNSSDVIASRYSDWIRDIGDRHYPDRLFRQVDVLFAAHSAGGH